MNDSKKEHIIVLIFVLFIMLITGVGYAAGESILEALGYSYLIADVTKEGHIEINEYSYIANNNQFNNVSYRTDETETGETISIETSVNLVYNSEFVLDFTVTNNSNKPFTYNGVNLSKTYGFDWSQTEYEIKYPRVYGINKGDVIGSGEEVHVRIYFLDDINTDHPNHNYPLTSTIELLFKEGAQSINDDYILTNITNININFDKRNIAIVNLSAKNLYSSSYDVKYSLSNSSLTLLNPSGDSSLSTSILDIDEEKNYKLQIFSENTITETITTDLFINEGEKIAKKIGTITINPHQSSEEGGSSSETPEEPESIEIANLRAEVSGNKDVKNQQGQYTISITNGNNFAISEWGIKIKVPEGSVTSLASWNSNIGSLDVENGIITITSENQYSHSHQAIEANSVLNYQLTLSTAQGQSHTEWGYTWYEYLGFEPSSITLDGKLEDGTWSYCNLIYGS